MHSKFSSTSELATASNSTVTEKETPKYVEVFYDGDCPLCTKEIKMLRRFDRRERILFTDIATPDFRAEAYGKTQDDFMAEIHGRDKNGEWIIGVEVFRQLYTAIGLGPLVWTTRLPLIRHLLDWMYRGFAKNRLRFTGRCSAESETCELEQASSGSH